MQNIIICLDEEAEEDAEIDRYTDTGKKIGAKKMAKLQEKKEKIQRREVECDIMLISRHRSQFPVMLCPNVLSIHSLNMLCPNILSIHSL